jgi:hypothetical protein
LSIAIPLVIDRGSGTNRSQAAAFGLHLDCGVGVPEDSLLKVYMDAGYPRITAMFGTPNESRLILDSESFEFDMTDFTNDNLPPATEEKSKPDKYYPGPRYTNT